MRHVLSVLLVLAAAVPANATIWRVPGDFQTIQQAVNASADGDEIEVSAGTYSENVTIIGKIVGLRSVHGPSQTLIQSITYDACGGFLNGFTITGPVTGDYIDWDMLMTTCVFRSAVHLAGRSGSEPYFSFYDCRFESDFDLEEISEDAGGPLVSHCQVRGRFTCWGDTPHISDSRFDGPAEITARFDGFANRSLFYGGLGWGANRASTIADCEVFDHTFYVYSAGAVPDQTVRVERCIVHRGEIEANGEPNIQIEGNVVYGGTAGISGTANWILNNTVVDCVVGIQAEVGMDQTVTGNITKGNGVGIQAEPNQNLQFVRCNDSYGNSQSNWSGIPDQTHLRGNIAVDPLFCDESLHDYHLQATSPCLPGNHPDGVNCGLIGALGQGCSPTLVETRSWGGMKSMFR